MLDHWNWCLKFIWKFFFVCFIKCRRKRNEINRIIEKKDKKERERKRQMQNNNNQQFFVSFSFLILLLLLSLLHKENSIWFYFLFRFVSTHRREKEKSKLNGWTNSFNWIQKSEKKRYKPRKYNQKKKRTKEGANEMKWKIAQIENNETN